MLCLRIKKKMKMKIKIKIKMLLLLPMMKTTSGHRHHQASVASLI